jgi:DNA repair protein RecO (recombination protein O)
VEYSTTALVLKIIKLGEADRIVVLYSPELGPIRAVAKSAANASSGYAAKTQVFNYCDLQLAKGKELDTFLQAKLIEDFRSLRADYDAMSLGYFMLEVLDHIAVLNVSYQQPFNIVYSHLKAIDNQVKSGAKPAQYLVLMSISFLWSIIDYLGYRPDLHTCSLSQRERRDNEIPSYFDFESGSVTSAKAYQQYIEHSPYQNHICKMSAGAFKMLSLLEANSDFALWDTSIEPADESQKLSSELDAEGALNLLRKHLSHQLEYDFKSWAVLEPTLYAA